jgi:molybdate/tungstate transport system ATP-binding protein
MIEVRVKKKLGEFLLDSELRDENFICIVGNNGSGKTSLLNVIAGVYEPDDGYVKLDSESLTGLSPEKRQVVLVNPDSYIPHFSVETHLVWGAKLNKRDIKDQTVFEVRKMLGIDFEGRVSNLSMGMKERVSLATALLAGPKAILVDEAFANIDNRGRFIKSYRDLTNKSKIDVIYATQHTEDSKGADHLYRMENGKLARVF